MVQGVAEMTSYACKDRPPYRQHMKVQDGHWDDGVQRIPKLTSVPFRTAKDCQYTLTELGKVDARCDGCKHRKDAHE